MWFDFKSGSVRFASIQRERCALPAARSALSVCVFRAIHAKKPNSFLSFYCFSNFYLPAGRLAKIRISRNMKVWHVLQSIYGVRRCWRRIAAGAFDSIIRKRRMRFASPLAGLLPFVLASAKRLNASHCCACIK